jgi:hypothetical protein
VHKERAVSGTYPADAQDHHDPFRRAVGVRIVTGSSAWDEAVISALPTLA